MYKSTFFAALFVFLGFTLRFVDATPPACLLACVNEQDEVHNYKAICKEDVANMASCLKGFCKPDDYDTAIDSYRASCKLEKFNVVIPSNVPTMTRSINTQTPTESSSTSTGTSGSDSAKGGHNDGSSASTIYYNSLLALITVFVAAAAL